jgi:hypothetical protein
VRRVAITIPPGTSPGALRVTASDAAGYAQLLSAAGRDGAQPRTLSEFVQRVNRQARNDYLYVTVSRAAAGARVAGRPLPGLPPSILQALTSETTAGDVQNLERQLVVDRAIEAGWALSGAASVDLIVEDH